MSNFRISDVHSETLEEVPSSPKKQTEPAQTNPKPSGLILSVTARVGHRNSSESILLEFILEHCSTGQSSFWSISELGVQIAIPSGVRRPNK